VRSEPTDQSLPGIRLGLRVQQGSSRDGRRTYTEPMASREYEVVLTPEEEGGYSVTVPALPGCVSQGRTREEALAMMREAIELYLALEA